MSRLFLERCPRRHLVINVDINKTIIQVDSAGGRTMEDVVNSNVAANVWGRPSCEGWTAVIGPGQPGDHSGLIAYDEYIDKKYAEPPGMRELPRAEREQAWKQISEMRRSAVRIFTHDGQAGENYKRYVEQQLAVLMAAPGCLIVPSFFEFINTLSEFNWSFTLLFRTFGNELDSVLREWRDFVHGRHVYQPRGEVLRRIRDTYVEEVTGCIFRDKDELFFCQGPDKAAVVTYPDGVETLLPEDIRTQLKQLPSCTEVHQTNFATLHDQLLGYAGRSNGVAGIVDYYPYWAQQAERRCGGKVFPVLIQSPAAPEEPPFYVFFDDNIFIGDDRSIVDLRDARTGEELRGKEVEAKYTVRVNPYEAIVNNDYFVDCLAVMVKLQLMGPLE